MVTIQKIFYKPCVFSDILKGISNTLQNLTFIEPIVDEIVGMGFQMTSPFGIVWVRNSVV